MYEYGFHTSYGFRASNPNITAWMEKMGYGQNYSLLEQHYEQKYVRFSSSHVIFH